MAHTYELFEELLRTAGLKATPQRLALLALLSNEQKPLTVMQVAKELPRINQVTLYRALETMVDKGLVGKVDTQHPATHYELLATKKHHHHAICADCGTIEDVALCVPKTLEQNVLKSLNGFSVITQHSLEFIGRCNTCTR